MRTRTLTATVLASSLLLLAGCGGSDSQATPAPGGDEQPSAGGVSIVATEFAFDPEDLSLPAGVDTEVTLDNQGMVEHDITVDELDLEIYAGATESVTRTVNVAAGTYDFYCSIPGHRSAGMEGTLTVD